MRKPVFLSGEKAAALINDNSTIATIGMTMVSASETILKAIEKRFLDTGSPNNLTLVHSCGQSDRDRGIQHFAHEHMLSRIIGGHWGLQPKMMNLIAENKILAYCIPQGQFAQLYRSMAGGEPGKITKVGLGTFIDPRIDGGRMNEITKNAPDIVDIVTIDQEEYMRYRPIPLDYVIIRGTYVDELGNLTTDEEAMQLEVFSAVMACKKFGGKVIAQAKYKVISGELHCKRVIVPGVFIDAVVICPNAEEDHRQTHSFSFNPAYCGDIKVPVSSSDKLALTVRKLIGRRALMELSPNDILNVGTGIPNDVIGPIIAEESIADDVTVTVESGIYGGIPMGGVDFGIAKNNFALIRHDDQFDYYNGAGVDVTYMGAGQIDSECNVNATRLGTLPTGAGGFIDITTNAKHVVFCSTFTGKGLSCSFYDQKLHIDQEGSLIKFVNQVNQISYNGKIARLKKQKMHYITERAVFKLCLDGLMLTEIAPGIDLKSQVLDLMEFKPIISPNLKEMHPSLFQAEHPFGLKEILYNKTIQ
ncbi:acyl CoA:acetate/3-ketoacid CoA transferase [Lachnotalea glycerini]|uniref:Acyl CoA:acetate/3-ketoacid CoA transferase n=1 Tax=Lachnotalea glycerini TaxID=1763509 RepID=A0A371J3J4_9FIRM|nr:CoA-transferase [Lachnotalea glycerini]RDY27351.1 acyl CoA:acetate/3-ketoacid CoA transferase [Lachnotalea glycerini]